jgi:BirA family transcriptional regulator, biotin operon repressor / biotin---[acetyl-CoA-carboxylase] ligase
MKGKILHILKIKKGIVSGEYLSDSLGISRVSIWKHIKKLRELGYDIESTSGGYGFISSPDILFPWEFPGREEKIHFFQETESTMDRARELSRKGCPDFTIVVSETQSRGRGRLKRSWLSEKGGLYFTVVLRPDISPILSYRINFAASLVLAKFLRNMFSIEAGVKWPNDILVNECKISGMLSEMEAEGDIISFINIGIGLNVNNDPSPKEQKAVSIKQLTGKISDRREILSGFVENLERTLVPGTPDYIDLDHIIPEWKKYTVTLGRTVKVVTHNEVFSGKAVDVDENGALIMEAEGGARRKIVYGDCFH